MPLKDPVHIYDAASNDDALLAQMFLDQYGIEAFDVGHSSIVGNWLLGVLPGIHKRQVWVDRADAEKARSLIQKYEEQKRSRNSGFADENDRTDPIQVVCEDCGKESFFPSSQRGSTQDCPHCGAYVDVGEVESLEE